MRRVMAAAVLILFASGVHGEEAKFSGTWSKKAEQGFTLKIAFKNDKELKFSMDSDGEGCVIDAKYTVKDGTVHCEVTKFEKKGNFPVEKEVGYKFSFKADVSGKTAKVSHFEGKDIDEAAKDILEGEYVKSEG